MRRRREDDPTYSYRENEARRKRLFDYYDYRGQLEKELLAAYESPLFSFRETMTFQQWREWLMTDDGQAFLRMANEQSSHYTEQHDTEPI